MNTAILSAEQLTQYNNDCFLADQLDALNLSPDSSKRLRQIVPSQKTTELFGVNIISNDDATLLRQVSAQTIAEYSAQVKADYIAQMTALATPAPIPPILVPIEQIDIDNAITQGWIFTEDGHRWTVTNNINTYSIEKIIDKTEFKNILNLV